ncbi:MAG: FtsX-like permease family protein [Candidatus Gracilibacteria bacterium]
MKILPFVFKDLMRRPGQLFVLLAGIAFAAAAAFILFSLRFGIEQSLYESAARKNPLSEITVYGKSSPLFNIFGQSQKVLNDEVMAEISKMPEVTQVSKHMIYSNLASIQIEIAGQPLQTDSLIFGTERKAITSDLPRDATWTADLEKNSVDSPIPVLISRKLIDLYNLSLAPSAGLPELSEDTFRGKSIKILPGYSSFFPTLGKPAKTWEGKIVGFSDRVDLVGITIPLQTVEALSAADGNTTRTYNKLFVTLNSAQNVEKVSAQLESQGMHVTSLQKEFKEIGKSLQLIQIIVFILSSIILAGAVILIGNSFWAILSVRSKEIGIMRAIGASRKTLSLIYFIEVGIMGFAGGILGTLIGLVSNAIFQKLIAKQISLYSISVESIFKPEIPFIFILLIGSVLLSLVAAAIPIFRILKKEPKTLFAK